MTTPARPLSTLAATGFVLATAFGLVLPVAAATPSAAAPDGSATPTPSVIIIGVEKGSVVPMIEIAPDNTPAGKRNIKSTSGTATTTKVSDKGAITYLITVRNLSSFVAKGLVVEYHFYTKTRTLSNGNAGTPVVTEVKSIDPAFDIDPGKSKEIETKPVPFENTQTQTTTATKNGYTVTSDSSGVSGLNPNTVISTSYAATETTQIGYHVEVRYNGKVIGNPMESPSNLQELLKTVYHFKP